MKPVKWLLQGGLTVEIKDGCVWILDAEDQILLDENEENAPSLNDVIDTLMAVNDALGYGTPRSVCELTNAAYQSGREH